MLCETKIRDERVYNPSSTLKVVGEMYPFKRGGPKLCLVKLRPLSHGLPSRGCRIE